MNTKKIISFTISLVLLMGMTGCVASKFIKNQITKKSNNEIIRKLESQYDKKFELVSIEKGGVTVGGRHIDDANLIRCMDDGTIFRYIHHSDGEIDDYYVPMKFGNEYFKKELKTKLDEVYGSGNYVSQAMLWPTESLYNGATVDGYKYENDDTIQLNIYIGVKVDNFDREVEAYRAAEIYNNIRECDSISLIVGYFSEIPDDIDYFLAFEITGVKDTFRSFYEEQMYAQLLAFSRTDGIKIPQDKMAEIIRTMDQYK